MAGNTPPADVPRRGRPRSETARREILKAAGELLLERGLNSISMDALAERAGASKATIYRWWPSKELLALDALFSEWEPARSDAHDTGTLTGDLNALIRPWARQLAAKPYARVIAALITRAQDDPRFAEQYHARFVEPRRDQARVIFARAIDRREIPPDTDIETALDLLYGPIYHRILHGHAKLTDRFARTVVDYVAGGAARPAVSRQQHRSASGSSARDTHD
ncbi:MAG TPA: TetR/AcrR family transcriptional regulator [Solirubrobacteraceae bacterium]